MRRPFVLLCALTAVLAACTPDQGAPPIDPADLVPTSVAGVTFTVPDGWEALDDGTPVGDSILARRTWRPEVDADRGLHVVVGCGDATVDELVTGATVIVRGGLRATDVEVDDQVTVVGLDAAKRATIRFEDNRSDGVLTTRGLYGTVDGHLVLLELTGPGEGPDPVIADTILGSVQVAPRTMPRCPDTGGAG